MPNASRNAASADVAKAESLAFEEALKRLESIVEAMESEDLPLETLLLKYEDGTKLVKVCQDKLGEAELKIQVLEKAASGEVKIKPMPQQKDSEAV